MARRDFPARQRLLALALEGCFFFGLAPLGLAGLAPISLGWLMLAAGGLLILARMAIALWSSAVHFSLGRGTPLHVMATQVLIIEPPYAYTRNPMALGTIAGYFGLGLVLQSVGALAIVVFLSGMLLIYIRRVEERELAERFGTAYQAYKQGTPFLLPRVRSRPTDPSV